MLEPKEMDTIVNACVEKLLAILPGILQNIAKNSARTAMLTTKFFRDNPDLVGKGDAVSRVFERFEGKNPGVPLDQLLPMVASEIRNAHKQSVQIGTKDVPLNLDVIDKSLGNL